MEHNLNELTKQELIHLIDNVVGIEHTLEMLIQLVNCQRQMGIRCWECEHILNTLRKK